MCPSVKKQVDMIAFSKAASLLRLGATIVFLSYLFAGASLALPTELRCSRCTKLGVASPMKPGTSCPLSHHGHDCHPKPGKVAGHITLCPDGCFHHDGQSGEIPSLAKFLSAPTSGLFNPLPAGPIPDEIFLSVLDLSFPPPDPPPSVRS